MSDLPRQLPPKKEVALALLEGPSLLIHLDPRRDGVIVPKWFTGQPQLVLQVGLNLPVPIPDLTVDEEGISCTLSFNRSPFWCRIPWGAVYALVGDDGRGMVWPNDVPPEVATQMQKAAAPAAKPGKKPKPKLAAVKADRDSKPPGPRTRSRQEARASDPDLDESQASAESEPSTEGGAALRRTEKPRPAPHLASAPSPSAPSSSSADTEDEASQTPKPRPVGPVGPVGPSSPGEKKPKRELPPYLRVIK